ncbi:MAG: glutamate-cysteine ligase family protein [Candidatus Omnitrophota bacterium]|nr:glutamate-cysteine ligase family protein [Candidatus Omnitrophota bacterium]
MSKLMGQDKGQERITEEDLAGYFQRFAKTREFMRVGVECEFFGVRARDGKAIPFDGPSGIEAILKWLAQNFGYEEVLEESRVIALKREDISVTLEPGGQVELSGAPVWNVFEIEAQIQEFVHELRESRCRFPELEWLAVGIQPFSRADDIAWVPKKRYEIMREHFRERGPMSHHMMKTTATNQVNFDYLSEENAMANLRVVYGITSIVSALFANSGFSEGRPNGYATKRLEIWNHTDPDRTGLLLRFLEPGATFQDYIEYLLKMPMIFLVRDRRWIPSDGRSFRTFLAEGYQGFSATLADFELHLSTAFPEARLKQYLEIRGVDCQSPHLMPAVAAFWKGILYDPETSDKAWKLVADVPLKERIRVHQNIPREGLKGRIGVRTVFEVARELVDLACASLAKQRTQTETRDECRFLDRIRKTIIAEGKSPAETMLEKWYADLGEDPARLLEYLRI